MCHNENNRPRLFRNGIMICPYRSIMMITIMFPVVRSGSSVVVVEITSAGEPPLHHHDAR
jgi:hypothetical protein